MGIPCGELVLSVSEQTTYRGRPVYVLHAHAYTNRALSLIYEVSDTLTSYIDAEGLFSWKYIKEIHEKKIREDREDTVVVYEYDHALGRWTENGVDKGDILPYTQDMLSAIFYLRCAAWSGETDVVHTPLNDTKKNYAMTFELGKIKRMRMERGWVDARVGKPHLELDGKYEQIGNNEVWFTADARRIPILVQSHIRLGSFYAKLIEYEPGQKPIAKNGP